MKLNRKLRKFYRKNPRIRRLRRERREDFTTLRRYVAESEVFRSRASEYIRLVKSYSGNETCNSQLLTGLRQESNVYPGEVRRELDYRRRILGECLQLGTVFILTPTITAAASHGYLTNLETALFASLTTAAALFLSNKYFEWQYGKDEDSRMRLRDAYKQARRNSRTEELEEMRGLTQRVLQNP